MESRTHKLKEAGQSLWLDNIQRRELHDGTLARMMAQEGVCGITSNPTIFMNAVSKSHDYDEQIQRLFGQGRPAGEIYHQITIEDIRDAGKLFLPVFEQTGGADGFVSIELNPQLAFSAEESVGEATQIVAELGLPNIMVKVPGTQQGLSVLRELVSRGINVNVTLLFSPERYRRVAATYIEALDERAGRGEDITGVHSVASFFISRIETKVDKRLDGLAATGCARELRGRGAVSVARVTYDIFRELFLGSRFEGLRERGGRVQRLLWASTGTKDSAYSDVKYVERLVVPGTINTLPPQTIEAFRDHGSADPAALENLSGASEILEQIERAGVSLAEIYVELEREGVKAFEKSYLELLQAIEQKGRALCSA